MRLTLELSTTTTKNTPAFVGALIITIVLAVFSSVGGA